MSGVLIEFPQAEAEALEKRLAGRHLTTAEEEAAMLAAQRLTLALSVERGASGNAEEPPFAERVRSLVGQEVVVETTYRAERCGKLVSVDSTEIATLDDGAARRPIAIGMIRSIAPVEDLAEAV